MREWISVLMDGESHPEEARITLNKLKNEPECREDWATYHLIGDALRGMPYLPVDIHVKLDKRLADEPTILAPRRRAKPLWVALSAAASVAAIALVGWVALKNTTELPLGTSQLASRQVTPLAQLDNLAMRAGVREYLIAHQEFSPSTAMQGVAPYVRTSYTAQGESAQ